MANENVYKGLSPKNSSVRR